MKRLTAIFAALLLSLSAMAQNDKLVQFGVDASVDCFLSTDNLAFSGGLGARARVGRIDQWVNFVGGLRYIYGPRLSGFQVPLMVNANLLKGGSLSGYLGAGYEFDFIGTYYGCMKFQAGAAWRHFDVRLFYKPYQGDLGAGFTYYF